MFGRNRKRVPGGRGTSASRRRRKLGQGFLQGRPLLLECLEPRRLLSLSPIISEVEAKNTDGILDEAGSNTKWLEIYNPDPQAAVNLNGWSLYYDNTQTTWNFPSGVTLGPEEFRVIFCDKTPTTDPIGELHTSFGLTSSGSTVELINPSGTAVSSLTYPSLSADTSYGAAETVTETDLVAAGATAAYYLPTSNATSLGTTWTQPGFSDSSWSTGATGLGFSGNVNGFATTVYTSSLTSIQSITTADAVINTPADQSGTPQTETAPYINYTNTPATAGDFSTNNLATGQDIADRTYPGMTIGTETDYYVMQATGTITIPTAGKWTFCANTADGFSCTINGNNFQYNGLRTPRIRWIRSISPVRARIPSASCSSPTRAIPAPASPPCRGP